MAAKWAEKLTDLRERETLFLGGGGFKTLSYLGVLEVLGWQRFRSVCGVSAGAIIALHLALGHSPFEIMGSFLEHEQLLVGSLSLGRLWAGHAPVRPEMVRQAIESILLRKGFKPDATMQDLAQRRPVGFSAVAFCLDTCKLVRFSADSHPGFRVAEVATACIAIPMLFSSVPLGEAGLRYYDAGLVNSAPLGFFPAKETLALVVRSLPVEVPTGLPETVQFRCLFMRTMAHENAANEGMAVMQVPYPTPGVGLLTRSNTPLSVFCETGALYTALYVIQGELVGVLAVLLSCLSFCGTSPPTGLFLSSRPTSPILSATLPSTPSCGA